MFAGPVTGVQLSDVSDDVILTEITVFISRSSDTCGVQCVRLSHLSDDVM